MKTFIPKQNSSSKQFIVTPQHISTIHSKTKQHFTKTKQNKTRMTNISRLLLLLFVGYLMIAKGHRLPSPQDVISRSRDVIIHSRYKTFLQL